MPRTARPAPRATAAGCRRPGLERWVGRGAPRWVGRGAPRWVGRGAPRWVGRGAPRWVGRGAPRWVVTLISLAMTVSLAMTAACAVGPSPEPDLAVFGGLGQVSTTTSAPNSTPPVGPGGPGRSSAPARWTPCYPDGSGDERGFVIECADITAPVSYPQPERGTLTVALARARSNGAADQPPLLVQGPVGSSSRRDIAAIAGALPREITDRFAIVVADPRGTGDSTGIDCVSRSAAAAMMGMAADPSTSAGAEQLAAISRALTFDCGDAVGPALTKLNSTNAADDIDTIRAALGVGTMSMIASGSGATIGALYAHRYPARAGLIVLAAPDDPLTDPAHHALAVSAAAQQVFEDFSAACARFSGGCPLGSDPEAAVADLVAAHATSGLPSGPWMMTGGSALLALLEFLPDQTRWAELAAALAGMRDRDGGALAAMLTAAPDGTGLTARLSAEVIYGCNDRPDRLTSDDIADLVTETSSASPLFGPVTAAIAGWCSAWPAPDESLERLSAAGAPPLLVLGSTGGIAHPLSEVRSVAGQLAPATLVTWQSASATPYPSSACVSEVVDGFLLGGVVPERGVLCPP